MVLRLPDRRRLLQSLLSLPLAFAPRFAWAAQPTDRRLIVIILRGGLDGLAAVPASGDPQFAAARGALAQNADGAMKLNDLFALDRHLAHLGTLYRQQQAIVFHAVALPYRERSHFDAQNILESGLATAGNHQSGWLNRALQAPTLTSGKPMGLALASAIPLILRGPVGVTSWMPARLPLPDNDIVTRIAAMYEGDPLLEPILRSASGNHSGREAMAADPGSGGNRAPGIAQQAARLLLDPDGPRVAVIDIGGYDSHAGQVIQDGRLAKALSELDNTIKAFAEALAPVWQQTCVLVITEFGRTVAVNGSGGTDHGTAAAAFLVGGNVNGGRVIADWPGLAPPQRYEGRDLKPTMDLRAVLKSVLAGQLRLDGQFVGRTVFPDGAALPEIRGLFRT